MEKRSHIHLISLADLTKVILSEIRGRSVLDPNDN